jgi:DnaJ-class molecular chaperone
MGDIEERTYYELLGVDPMATTEEIKEAYREIARIFHPDSNFYSDIIADAGPEDSDVFKAISNAYQVLVNEQRRKEYDESLNLDIYTGWDDGSSDDSRNPSDEDIPEEWIKEREFFAQHFEEILRPAPKSDLLGTEDVATDESEPVSEAIEPSEEEIEPRIQLSRFGRVASDKELSFVSSAVPVARRPHRVRYDPIDILLFVGIPVMFLIVVVEILLYL